MIEAVLNEIGADPTLLTTDGGDQGRTRHIIHLTTVGKGTTHLTTVRKGTTHDRVLPTGHHLEGVIGPTHHTTQDTIHQITITTGEAATVPCLPAFHRRGGEATGATSLPHQGEATGTASLPRLGEATVVAIHPCIGCQGGVTLEAYPLHGGAGVITLFPGVAVGADIPDHLHPPIGGA